MNKAVSLQDPSSLASALRKIQTFPNYLAILKTINSKFEKQLFNLNELTKIAVDLSENPESGPFGAVLAQKVGEAYAILGVGSNLVVANNNSMLHAETVALINFLQQHPKENMLPENTVLVTSCEPCSQCRSYFLAMGGNPQNIKSVLTKSDANIFGGFADDSLYEIVTKPISVRKINWTDIYD